MAASKKVRIFVDRTPGDTTPDEFIGVNGKGYLLPKGKYSEVPKEVADEYNRVKAARIHADAHAEQLIEENRQKERDSEAQMA